MYSENFDDRVLSAVRKINRRYERGASIEEISMHSATYSRFTEECLSRLIANGSVTQTKVISSTEEDAETVLYWEIAE